MARIKQEFSRNAKYYDQFNQIQKEVVKDLLSEIKDTPKNILDIGAGRGEVFSRIDWPLENFTAIDFSPQMCTLHPKGPGIEVIQGDFNDNRTYEEIKGHQFDRIISASALQWATDIEAVFRHISALNTPVALALFTSETFSSLHERVGVRSPLHSKATIEAAAYTYFNAVSFTKRYRLTFDTTREMLNYIKKSGVSSGEKKLSIAHLRDLIKENRLKTIAAEVVFILS